MSSHLMSTYLYGCCPAVNAIVRTPVLSEVVPARGACLGPLGALQVCGAGRKAASAVVLSGKLGRKKQMQQENEYTNKIMTNDDNKKNA